jgi:hypothetical protein
VTQPGAEPAAEGSSGEVRGGPRPAAIVVRWAPGLLVGAGVALVLGLFLFPYATGRLSTPIGGDTPWYIARERLVSNEGLGSLSRTHTTGIALKALGDRPGYPVAASLITSVAGIDAYDLVFVLPAVIAVTAGLAAAALGIEVLSEPRWTGAVYLVGVGASVFIARTAVMSYDNLIVDGLLIAAAVCAVLVCDGRPATGAAVYLLGAAALTHWRFLAPFLLLLVGLDLFLLPDAVRRIKNGERTRRTPAFRLLRLVGVAVVSALAALALAPSRSFKLPKVQAARVLKESADWMPGFRLPVTGPWAVAGAVALWTPRDAKRRWTLYLMAMWALSVPAAALLSHVMGGHFPIYRITAFALGIPVLATAATISVARLVATRWAPVGVILATLVVAAGLALTLRISDDLWSVQKPAVAPEDVRELSIVSAYLAQVGGTPPVVFVVERGTGTQPARAISALLSPDVAARSALCLGSPTNLLAGQPTLDPADSGFNKKSLKAWRLTQPLLSQDPIILRLAAFAGGVSPQGGWPSIGPGATLVRGPLPARMIAAPTVFARSIGSLIGGSLVVLLVAFVTGSGWSVGLVPGNAFACWLLAPTFGFATLVVFGVAAARLGVAPSGVGGVIVTLVATASGWALAEGGALWRRRRTRRGSPDRDPTPISGSVDAPSGGD